jgi:hypothetical protein
LKTPYRSLYRLTTHAESKKTHLVLNEIKWFHILVPKMWHFFCLKLKHFWLHGMSEWENVWSTKCLYLRQ